MQITNILLQLPVEEQFQHHVTCDLCGVSSYAGISYKCLVCNDWDYCSVCYCLGRHSRNHIQLKMQSRNYSDYLTVSKKIVKAAAKLEMDEDSKTHVGYSCAACGLDPIHGVRYVCLTCGQCNLCQKCEAKHHRKHIFLKFRYPFKDTSFLTEEEKVILTAYIDVISQNVYREPIFFPVFAKTVSLDENLFKIGNWKLHLSGPPSFQLQVIDIPMTQVEQEDEHVQEYFSNAPLEKAICFRAEIFSFKATGIMSEKFVEMQCPSVSLIGVRENDGYYGIFENSVKSAFVFKLQHGA